MLNLGGEVEHNGRKQRVVRIVGKDLTLFENETEACVVEETYVMLKDEAGNVSFMVLSSEKSPYNGTRSTIKGLDPLAWRKP